MLGQAPLGGMNDILRPTALQRWGHRREAMPLRWSLADPVASVAINMALPKELFASSQLARRRVKDTPAQSAVGMVLPGSEPSYVASYNGLL